MVMLLSEFKKRKKKRRDKAQKVLAEQLVEYIPTDPRKAAEIAEFVFLRLDVYLYF